MDLDEIGRLAAHSRGVKDDLYLQFFGSLIDDSHKLFRFVVKFSSQRRQLSRRQCLAGPPKRRKENCVHPENLPGNIADREIKVVEIPHPQFLGALTYLGE